MESSIRGPHAGNILLFPGLEPGGESQTGGWTTWITGMSPTSFSSQYNLGVGFACALMQGSATCNYLGVDVVQQDDAARKMLQPILSSVNPDLGAFKAHGGKIIQYAG